MSQSSYHAASAVSRRSFLAGTVTGLATGVPLAWLGLRALRGSAPPVNAPSLFTGRTTESPRPVYAMPGPYPGRVIEVQHPTSVRSDLTICRETVATMMGRGMTALTGADHPVEAWRRFFEPGDVVGIKVNPVGRKPKPGERGRRRSAAGSISNPEVLLEVVKGLKSAGVHAKDIVVFERYAEEFCDAGYNQVLKERELDGVRWCAAASSYDNSQLNITGFPDGRSRCAPEIARHVVGYDPDVFVHMGFAMKEHSTRDDRRFRSHLSMVVTRMVNKFITLPVLKDHRSAGVTLALKNLSHGLNNNVARSHLADFSYGGFAAQGARTRIAGPNQCNTFIPTAVAQEPIKQKAVLHILDGLIGVYEGGPGSWNRTWATWPYRGLFFATDPVALDHVGWDILDAKRVAEGLRPVAHIGLSHYSPGTAASLDLAPLASVNPADALALAVAANELKEGWRSESFDRRQPEHVILASTLNLGVFDARHIEHRRIGLQI